jgi:hypothetical protein
MWCGETMGCKWNNKRANCGWITIDLIDRYLKSVDKFNEWTVSAFVTPGSKRDPRT